MLSNCLPLSLDFLFRAVEMEIDHDENHLSGRKWCNQLGDFLLK